MNWLLIVFTFANIAFTPHGSTAELRYVISIPYATREECNVQAAKVNWNTWRSDQIAYCIPDD